jgi:cation:H+ antiporter
MKYIILLIGFILLIKSADYFVIGASSIAKSLNIPTIIIGLTIVAFGTSAPEAAVSISAAMKGQNDIAIANVVGSNIFNILFVLGVSAVIAPVKVQKTTIIKEFPFALLASLVLLILSHDIRFQGYNENVLTRSDGLMLFALFFIFMYYLLEMAISSKEEMNVEQGSSRDPIIKSILLSIGGIIGIIISGNLVVDSAINIAIDLGMSENLVGLTIVSIGTSLPEFVTSLVAAKKGESDIVMGNIIGSNIFNILFVLGASAIIHTMHVQPIVFIDMIIMLIATVITYLFAVSKKQVNRFEGIILILTYVVYIIFIIIRQ